MTMAQGWYPDPFSSAYLRWWDGQKWTSSTTVAGQPSPAPNLPPATYQPPPAPYEQTPTPTTAPYQPPTEYPYPAPNPPPWEAYATQPAPPLVAPFPLATWGSRFGARLIDWLILSAVLLPAGFALMWQPFKHFVDSLPPDGRSPSQHVITDFYGQVFGRVLLLSLVSLVLQFVYEVPQLVAFGRTPGKRVLGLRIRPLAEDRLLTWKEATIRWGVVALGGLVGGGLFTLLDDLFPLWDKPWQQTLHDKAAKTVVVPL